jgi:hypothetical protein
VKTATRAKPGRPLCGAAESTPELAKVATTELEPVYLIAGGDRPKIQRALRRLRDRVGEDAVEILTAVESTGDDAVAACNALGLFSGGPTRKQSPRMSARRRPTRCSRSWARR